MIWTDCDREGEHIGSEIVGVVTQVNSRIKISRARFSAIIPTCIPFPFEFGSPHMLTRMYRQIRNALHNPVDLDMRQANAVAARIDLDLRLGAAMTRLQTLRLQASFPEGLAEKVVSYGTVLHRKMFEMATLTDASRRTLPVPNLGLCGGPVRESAQLCARVILVHPFGFRARRRERPLFLAT